MIRELDRVVLTTKLSALGLEAGDLGTVVLVHDAGRGFEVEFVTLGGRTLAITTMMTRDVRPVGDNEMACARQVAPS